MSIAALHRRAIGSFTERAAAIDDGQWHAATGCGDWSVRDLVNHVVTGNREVPPVLAGGRGADVPGLSDDLLGDEPKRAAEEAGAAAAAAIEADGAFDGIKHPRHGDFPGEAYAWQRFTENLIHGWDLAHATGGDETLDPELVAACTAFFDQAEDVYRQAGFVGPRTPAPEGADAQTLLLARFGRKV